MNIFVLDEVPQQAARMHCDQHIYKMILEYAQLLSTAHRILDGKEQRFVGEDAKPRTFWLLPGEQVVETKNDKDRWVLKIRKPVVYNVTHCNHPAALWARETSANYVWLSRLLSCLLAEFEYRREKFHATDLLYARALQYAPANIRQGRRTDWPQTMPDEYKVPGDAVEAYRRLYCGPKSRFATWKVRPAPSWYVPSA